MLTAYYGGRWTIKASMLASHHVHAWGVQLVLFLDYGAFLKQGYPK
jgi:hypothetical protein